MKVRENYNRHARGRRSSRTANHRLNLNARKSVLLERIKKQGKSHVHGNFACGRGQDALKIMHTFDNEKVDVHNFDFSDLCLDEFKSRTYNHPLSTAKHISWNFNCTDLREWECETPEVFDSASCFLAFHYLNGSENFLRNLARSMRSGACAALVFPDSDFILGEMKKAIEDSAEKKDYYAFGKDKDDKHLFNIFFSFDHYSAFNSGTEPKLTYYFSLEESISDVPENIVLKETFIEEARKNGFEVTLCENASTMEIPDDLALKMRIDKRREMSKYEKYALSLYLCVIIRKL